jgi:hypothetical protein
MRMEEWDRSGREPTFGHQMDWIEDLLESMGTSEIASYAILVHDGEPKRERFLVATDLGLFDADLTVDEHDEPQMVSRLVPWSGIGGVELKAHTDLDVAYRHASRWRFTIPEPEVDIEEGPDADALLALWRECVTRTATTTKPAGPE